MNGLVIFPDSYSHPTGVTAVVSANEGDKAFSNNSWSGESWTKMEEAGCVFLPAAGSRTGALVSNPNSSGHYSSSTPDGTDTNNAYSLAFNKRGIKAASSGIRYSGRSVRLVQIQN